jgi:hypothetical protein
MFRSSWLVRGSRLEQFSEFPDRPDDASQLVGHGGGGFVVTAAVLHIERPSEKAVSIGLQFGSPQHGAGPVDEEHPEIDIAPLTDPA